MLEEYMKYIINEGQNYLFHASLFIPRLLVAVLLVIITKLLASVLKNLSIKVLRALGMNVIAKKTGLNRLIETIPAAENLSELISLGIYWIIMFAGFAYALNYLGFKPAEMLLNSIIAYIPRIFIALIIFVIGAYLADFMGVWAENTAKVFKVKYSQIIGSSVKYLIVFLTFVTIFDELELNLEFIRVGAYILLGAFVVLMILVLGMASIRTGREIISGLSLKTYLRAGDIIEYEGKRCKIDELHSTAVVIEDEEKKLIIPNTILSESKIIKIEVDA